MRLNKYKVKHPGRAKHIGKPSFKARPKKTSPGKQPGIVLNKTKVKGNTRAKKSLGIGQASLRGHGMRKGKE